MRRQRGFTIVELVVVLTIMAILLVLVTVGLNASQVNARDAKRKADIEAISRGLEVRYKQGNQKITSAPGVNYSAGGYPGVLEYLHLLGWDLTNNNFVPAQVVGGYLTEALPGTSPSNFMSPGKNYGIDIYCFFCGVGPEDSARINSIVTTDKYIYEPLTATGGQCNGEQCERYNLYYRTEADNVVHTVRSDHQ
jgi:prepilin-type N-terminal cleavage/methylation domain-containing protein